MIHDSGFMNNETTSTTVCFSVFMNLKSYILNH